MLTSVSRDSFVDAQPYYQHLLHIAEFARPSNECASATIPIHQPYPPEMLHELWDDGEDGQTFCLAGPMGDDARAMLSDGAVLVWTVEAHSHFEAMTLYYQHMEWGTYTTDQPWDRRTYAEHGWE